MQKVDESLPDFKKFQYQFTQHLRSPQKNSRPFGAPANRMKVYNELVFNGFEDVLSGCFPVLKEILKKKKWNHLVREFLTEHRCQKPFYRQIPDEFIDYLQQKRKPKAGDLPFLIPLAHYEWMELVLFLSTKEMDEVKINLKGDLLENYPLFAPTATLLQYSYPVHQISPSFQPKKASEIPFFYLLFRNREDQVKFIVLNPITARLTDLLLNSKVTGKEAIEQITKELNHPNSEIVLDGGRKALQELKKEGAILGVLKE